MNRTAYYEIRVEGHLGENVAAWFTGLKIRHEGDESGPAYTVLFGWVIDQTALHGILMRIRDLGLPLVSVQRGRLEKTIVRGG
jgi:hypothetical protein